MIPLALALALAPAHAADSGGAGLSVGSFTLAGELSGAVALGAIGGGIGSLMCDTEDWRCDAPALGLGVGAALGFVGGGLAGSALGAHRVGRKPGRAVAWSAVGLALGGTLTAVAFSTDDVPAPLMVTAVVISMPLGGGIATATQGRASLSLDLGPASAWAKGPERVTVGLRVRI